MKTLIVFVGAWLSGSAFWQGAAGANSIHPAQIKIAQASDSMTDGEIRKIDKEAGKLTIRHGPIRNLDMPGMTMVFRVKEPAMLDRVKVGGKIKFTVENIDGILTVVQLEGTE